MTRALAITLIVAVAVGVLVAFAAQMLPRAGRPPRRTAQPVEPARTAPVRVLAGQDAARAAILRERHPVADAAAFADRALAEALGAPEGARFVEIVLVNRDAAEGPAFAEPPLVRAPDGRAARLCPLRDLMPGGRPPSPHAAMLAAALGGPWEQPLRKGTSRRAVFGLPEGFAFRDLASADVDGLELAARETTAPALDAFVERPRPDVIAALGALVEETR